jgi:hypothetical protein
MKKSKNLEYEPVHQKNVLLAFVVHGISCLSDINFMAENPCLNPKVVDSKTFLIPSINKSTHQNLNKKHLLSVQTDELKASSVQQTGKQHSFAGPKTSSSSLT